MHEVDRLTHSIEFGVLSLVHLIRVCVRVCNVGSVL